MPCCSKEHKESRYLSKPHILLLKLSPKCEMYMFDVVLFLPSFFGVLVVSVLIWGAFVGEKKRAGGGR